MLHLWMREHLIVRIDGCVRNAEARERVEPMLRRVLREDRFHVLYELRPMGVAIFHL